MEEGATTDTLQKLFKFLREGGDLSIISICDCGSTNTFEINMTYYKSIECEDNSVLIYDEFGTAIIINVDGDESAGGIAIEYFNIKSSDIVNEFALTTICNDSRVILVDNKKFDCNHCFVTVDLQSTTNLKQAAIDLGYFYHNTWIIHHHRVDLPMHNDLRDFILTTKKCIKCQSLAKIERLQPYCANCLLYLDRFNKKHLELEIQMLAEIVNRNNLQGKFTTGKYKDKSFKYVAKYDMKYIIWVLGNNNKNMPGKIDKDKEKLIGCIQY
jgi:hypothetical protein